MRLTLTDTEAQELLEILEFARSNSDDLYIKIESQIWENQQRDISEKQRAVKKATATRSVKAKEKIENAINVLRLENKDITVYAVAKAAKVSYNTSRKYEDFIKSQKIAKILTAI
jgi:beta-phosphoglucomutase-like phosphatase (HAD superfamily)